MTPNTQGIEGIEPHSRAMNKIQNVIVDARHERVELVPPDALDLSQVRTRDLDPGGRSGLSPLPLSGGKGT